MELQTSYDYKTLYEMFSNLIESHMGLTMIELNSNGRPPAAPYVAFDIISPYIPLNALEDDKTFEAVVSFTVYSQSKVQALNLADRCRQLLGTQTTDDVCQIANAVIVERMPTQIRNSLETTAVAYMVGFDTRLRLRETFADNVDPILDIDFKQKGD